MNVHRSIRLHSHDVKYGSGSGQQSVTGVDDKDDVNSHWAVKGPTAKKFCERGIPVGEFNILTIELLIVVTSALDENPLQPPTSFQSAAKRSGWSI